MRKTMTFAVLGSAILAGAAYAGAPAPAEVEYADGAIAASLTGVPGDPANGKMIVGSKKHGNCVACHAAEALSDVQWHGEVGPPLDGAGSRWTEAELRGIVADAKMTFDGTVMPSFYKDSGYVRPGDAFTGKAAKELKPLLSAQQIEDVVAFLMTLKDE